MRGSKQTERAHKSKIRHHVAKHAKKTLTCAKHIFVPHEGNGHKPHAVRHRSLGTYAAILVLVKFLVLSIYLTFPSNDLSAMAITPDSILTITNQARVALNLQAFKWNDKLASAAAAKAQDMLDKQYFSHISPAGVTPWYWIKKFGYVYKYSAENLAVHYTSAENVQNAWLASPAHKQNIINPKFTDIGIGVAIGNFENSPSIFVVQMFGKPLNDGQTPTTTSALTAVTSKVSIATAAQAKRTIALTTTSENKAKVLGAESEIPDQNVQTDKATSSTLATSTTQVGTMQQIFGLADKAQSELIFNRFSADDFNRVAHAVYLFFFLFVVVALTINIVIKFHIQHADIICHALVIICLAGVLLVLH